MKKLFALLLSAVLALSGAVCAFAKEDAPVKVAAKAAVLMDLNTGKVLYAMKENDRLYPASVTKIMSLLLVMEAVESGKIKLTDKVAASENAVSFGGSQIWLEVGEEMSVDDMLKAVSIASANDACTALGEYVSGSSEAFVGAMNARAKQLGMKNTHFENCTGLDETEKNHYSSALDIALMSRALMRYDLIKKYSATWMDSLRGGKTELVNTNRLVRFYQGCVGLKTGTTTTAGFCLSAVAQREESCLCAVVLGSKTSQERFDSAAALLDYGFANFETVSPRITLPQGGSLPVEGAMQSTVSLSLAQKKVLLSVPKGEGANVSTKIELPEKLRAPLEKGQTVGKITFYLGEEPLGSVGIIAGESAELLNFWGALEKLFKSGLTNFN